MNNKWPTMNNKWPTMNDRLAEALGVKFCITCNKEIDIINIDHCNHQPDKVNNSNCCITTSCTRTAFTTIHFIRGTFNEFATCCEFCYNNYYTDHHRAQ